MTKIDALPFLFIIQLLIVFIALSVLLAGVKDADSDNETGNIPASAETYKERDVGKMWAKTFIETAGDRAILQESSDESKSETTVAQYQKDKKTLPYNTPDNKGKYVNDQN